MSLREQTTKVERIVNKIFRKFNVNENSHINLENYNEITDIVNELSIADGISPEYILKVLRIS